VMYLGKIVELADRKSLYEAPMHPYTKALMSAVPVPDPRRRGVKSERILLKGDVPSPISPPTGCRFHTRCWKATEICTKQEPPLIALKPGQQVACHHPENAQDQAPEDVALASAREAIEIVRATPKSAEAPVVSVTEASGAAEASAATLDKAPDAEVRPEDDASVAGVPSPARASGAEARDASAETGGTVDAEPAGSVAEGAGTGPQADVASHAGGDCDGPGVAEGGAAEASGDISKA